MDKKYVAGEFCFIRDKLKTIASLLTRKDTEYIIEAAFLVGCLHTICAEHAVNFNKKEKNIDE